MAEIKTAKQVLELLTSKIPDKEADKREMYRIGDLAREFDVSLRTLRFYEDRGLLHPKRSGSTRLYSGADRKRLRVILVTKSVGFSLVDIEEMLHLYDSDNQDIASMEIILDKFEAQLQALMAQRAETERAIATLQCVTRKIHEVS